MLLFVFPLSYSNVPAESSNDNTLDEPSATAGYEIPVSPCTAYKTTQFTYEQSLEGSYAYVDVQP